MNPKKLKIVLIGSGNVATHLAQALYKAGFSIAQVYSRTLEHAQQLAQTIHAEYTDNVGELVPDGDLYIFSLKDSALQPVLESLPSLPGIFVHTAGSVPLSLFERYHDRNGVMYPLQTFSKQREVDMKTVPFFIEANTQEDARLLRDVASALSSQVQELSSERRKTLHLAAVFANNFTNHLYAQAADLLEKNELPWDLLLPLIRETAAKVERLHPKQAQTGPAVRYDKNVINEHLKMLSHDPDKQAIYSLLTESIHKMD